MNTRVAALLLSLLALLPAPASAQDEDAERLRIHGSNVLGAQVVPNLVDAWLKDLGYAQISHRRINAQRLEIRAVRDEMPLIVEIDKRGTAAGFADISAGNAEIAMATRQPNAAELDAAWQLGDLTSPDQEWVLGLDGLAVLVAPGNPVAALSVDQLQGVLSGRIADWKQLGGSAGPIHLHGLATNSGTGELLSKLVLRGAAPARGTQTASSQEALTAALARDPAGLGVLGMRAPRGGLKALAIRAGASALPPERLPVSSEDYPLQRRVYFHTGQLITALGRSFVLYAISPRGQAVVEKSALLSLNLRPMAPGPLEKAPREYQQLVASAQRLPMTVRFGHGLDLLDSRSRQDVERLANYLHRPENASRRVLLVGFANPKPGAPFESLTMSQERVDYLSSELLALNMKVVSVRGFGGSLNLLDASQPGARYRNDRVEIWLR